MQAVALPANRAFVVQFRVAALEGAEAMGGRVEHLDSGQATHFESWAELQTFIEQVLAQVQDHPP